MSVYDPYPGRYSVYRSPSVRSYSYAPSRTYTSSVYTDDWHTRSLQPAVVSERMYFSLNGKLVRSYKIRNYRVCRSCFPARTTHFEIDSSISIPKSNTASSETCPRLVSGGTARHCFFPHPVLCHAPGVFRYDVKGTMDTSSLLLSESQCT